MIKLVIFDLDGVLIDSKEYHYEALNLALGDQYKISQEEHIRDYDGLPTSEKLRILSERKGLSPSKFDQIWKDKQENTLNIFKNLYLKIMNL